MRRDRTPTGAGFGSQESGIAASRDALSYASLCMQGPTEQTRGELKAADPIESFAKQLAESFPGVGEVPREVAGRFWRNAMPGLGPVKLPEHAVSVATLKGHATACYPMESPGALDADGQLHSLTLMRRDGEAKRVYRCVPVVDTNVYELAFFENPLGTTLLEGPVRVYKGGDFVVTAPLKRTSPAEEIMVNLGVEPSIRVARNTHFSESTSGLFGGGTVLHHKIELKVRSNLPRASKVEVIERIPVTREEEVKIELISSKPTAEPYSQKDRGRRIKGGWIFPLSLGANEEVSCSLEYQITIPTKRVLEGGNRRG